ncbi:Alcohol dehydrogenase [Rhodococcus wratislaviensis]|uniref:Alcohol dehydrogenase n=1 Tax=Rhodococcus wratislaviensis TaxID=44752 RepID=A0A402C5E4_RHOWR|nr:MDR family oxidoreductase [Rhodococcus wratislaviensis]GCE38865.1 Alcohol dehydrogenase [Rhodococcus wratislaviensis]
MSENFKAILIEDTDAGAVAALKEITIEDLPDRDVLVEVRYSSLNYKDGLALGGNRSKVARTLPMVGGIDLAGTVVESRSPEWKAGDQVLVNGWGMSESNWGGYSMYQRVDPGWLVRLPDAFTPQQAMAIGTAGYTAALCVNALEKWGALPDGGGDVLVTGAAGGVGSVAIALLAAQGQRVTASTGRADSHDYLRGLGAHATLDRNELSSKGRPLQKERWSCAIDSVGSSTLVNVLAQTAYGGAVAACGLAGGPDLPGTVLPHILRGVALLGVDSVMAPMPLREAAWARLARDLKPELLADMTRVEPMSQIIDQAGEILAGRVQGRVVVDVTR